MDALRKEAARTREFLSTPKRMGSKGKELKSNVTDPESAKMATSKGVMQGYAAQAVVDSANQIIIAADVIGSGSEQAMLLPMIEQASACRASDTLVTADAGYHSDANIAQLMEHGIPAMVADNQMRYRDERFAQQDKHKGKPDPLPQKKATGQDKEVTRFRPSDFTFNDDNTATCPAGQLLRSPGTVYTTARFELPKLHRQSNRLRIMPLQKAMPQRPHKAQRRTRPPSHPFRAQTQRQHQPQ